MGIPLVTIFTITRNRCDLLPRAMRSILNQTYRNIEYIIIDSASSDNTERVVQSFNDCRIRYIKLEENKSFGSCVNMAVELASGKYVSELDDDDEYDLAKIEKQVALFESLGDDYGMVYCWMTYFDNKTGEKLKVHKAELRGNIIKDVIEQPTVSGTPTLLFRKDIFDKIGGYKEADEIGVESDWEFACRICYNYKVDYVPASLVNVYVNHSHQRMSDKGYYKNAIEANLKFEKYFLSEFADIFTKNRKAARDHYCSMSHSYFVLNDYKNGIFSYFKMLKAQPSIKQILYPLKGIIGR